MIDGALRGRGVWNVASELGFKLSEEIKLCTDSSAAKSFVSKRGLGGMRHLQLRDLWLQQEVGEGRVVVEKVPGIGNPADLMTKFLGRTEVAERLRMLHLFPVWSSEFGDT